MEVVIWVLIIILLMISSVLTRDVKNLLFAVGGLTAIILHMFKMDFMWQFLTFVITGLIITYFLNEKLSDCFIKFCDKYFKKKNKEIDEEKAD